MLMVGFRGTDVSDDDPIVGHIRSGAVGNVLLFERDLTADGGSDRNIRSPEQVKALIRTLKAAVPTAIPLWVAIDQEGGRVQRLRPNRGFQENYPSAQTLGQGSVDETHAVAGRMGRELADLGIDMDFAPVVDVNVDPLSPAIGKIGRSFGADPERVARHGMAFGDGLERTGILPCLKHFPGHGSARADTHNGAADVSDTWRSIELVPYRRAFAAGWSGAVMTSHVFHASLDSKYPASLSRTITTELLRGILGWSGLVVTDDLHMGAVTEHYSIEETIRLAVLAGADILIFSNNAPGRTYDPDFPVRAHRTLISLVRDGVISEERMFESWCRITRAKEEWQRLRERMLRHGRSPKSIRSS